MAPHKFTIQQNRKVRKGTSLAPDFLVADGNENIVYIVKSPRGTKQYQFYSVDQTSPQPIAVIQRHPRKPKYEFFYDGELCAKIRYKYHWGFNLDAQVRIGDEVELLRVKGGTFAKKLAIRAANDPGQLDLGKIKLRPLSGSSELYIDRAENEVLFLGLFFCAFNVRMWHIKASAM